MFDRMIAAVEVLALRATVRMLRKQDEVQKRTIATLHAAADDMRTTIAISREKIRELEARTVRIDVGSARNCQHCGDPVDPEDEAASYCKT